MEHIEGKIWELRPGNYRFIFFVWGDKFVLTNAFRKKGRKTPDNEKAIAKKRYSDWIKRFGHK
ncbi:type II toxin-antitoxin system RelE/ParE family toxin [Paenibacillus sp. UY79]|nr:type II toxin-antitoxin system RelE/ParE family toxin [Paenibacillus farraposensis]